MSKPYYKQYDFLFSLGFHESETLYKGDRLSNSISFRHPETFNSITLIIRRDEVTHYYYNGHKDSLVGLYEPDFEKFARKLAGKE